MVSLLSASLTLPSPTGRTTAPRAGAEAGDALDFLALLAPAPDAAAPVPAVATDGLDRPPLAAPGNALPVEALFDPTTIALPELPMAFGAAAGARDVDGREPSPLPSMLGAIAGRHDADMAEGSAPLPSISFTPSQRAAGVLQNTAVTPLVAASPAPAPTPTPEALPAADKSPASPSPPRATTSLALATVSVLALAATQPIELTGPEAKPAPTDPVAPPLALLRPAPTLPTRIERKDRQPTGKNTPRDDAPAAEGQATDPTGTGIAPTLTVAPESAATPPLPAMTAAPASTTDGSAVMAPEAQVPAEVGRPTAPGAEAAATPQVLVSGSPSHPAASAPVLPSVLTGPALTADRFDRAVTPLPTTGNRAAPAAGGVSKPASASSGRAPAATLPRQLAPDQTVVELPAGDGTIDVSAPPLREALLPTTSNAAPIPPASTMSEPVTMPIPDGKVAAPSPTPATSNVIADARAFAVDNGALREATTDRTVPISAERTKAPEPHAAASIEARLLGLAPSPNRPALRATTGGLLTRGAPTAFASSPTPNAGDHTAPFRPGTLGTAGPAPAPAIPSATAAAGPVGTAPLAQVSINPGSTAPAPAPLLSDGASADIVPTIVRAEPLPRPTTPPALPATDAAGSPAPDAMPSRPRSEPAFRAFAAAMFDAARDPAAALAPVSGPAAPAPAASATTPQPPLDLTQSRWPQAMVDRIERLRDDANMGDTRIRLIPDALGTIDVSLRREGETVHVAFRADQAETRQILADARPELTALAETRGLKLGDASVTGANLSPTNAANGAFAGAPANPNAQGGERGQRQHPQTSNPAAPPRAAQAAEDEGDDIRIA
jgi:Meckel syndrome type 1 protein